MPQVLLAIVAGAGLYAGYRWLSRKTSEKPMRRAQAPSQSRPSQRRADAARDLGPLEFDAVSKVYRPRSR